MNYCSLAILSRCPQAPVPNLGQYDHHSQSIPAAVSTDHLPSSSEPCHSTDAAVSLAAEPHPIASLSAGADDDDDDFDDFKTAATSQTSIQSNDARSTYG